MDRIRYLLITTLLAVAPIAQAQTAHIDQANTPAARPWFWLNAACPTLQDFIPTNSWINFVDLHFKGQDQYRTLVWVNILHGTNIIVSRLQFGAGTMLEDTQDYLVRCYFDSTVELSPGDTYTISVERLDDEAGVAVAADSTGGYHRGRMMANGAPVPGYSLWFREGYVESPPRNHSKAFGEDRSLTLRLQHFDNWTAISVTAGSITNRSPGVIAYKLQYSDDFISWADAPGAGISTYADGSTITLYDTSSMRPSGRFYRALDISSDATMSARAVWRQPTPALLPENSK